MSSTAYRLTSLRVLFGARLALNIEELTIGEGSLHILMGPNGSGKSTLLDVLAFLRKPDCGQVAFRGVPVNWAAKEVGALRRQVTLLHQDAYLFSGTVMANVAYGLKLRGTDKKEIRRAVESALAHVGLGGFETRDAAQLSGGEGRRVALARAMVCQPRVLLLDEPLSHVDRESSDIIEGLIAARSREGRTSVMASHDASVGERLPSTVIRLAEGRIASDDDC